ncbi:MAG: outer membrane beta-barrel protein [Myxococcota bacterium]|nr:outer membrane beta-barrel protein [Myxococcota bacterium]
MQPSVWTRLRAIGASVTVVAFAVAPAGAANDIDDEMKQMRELVLQLQDQVQNQQVEIEEQSEVLRDAGLEDRSSASRLSSFLESTDFSGTVAASYFYNTNNPLIPNTLGGKTGAGGNNAVSNPFHPDHNSIQLDEVWLSMSRSASDESPVGFGIDLVYGALGSINGYSDDMGVLAGGGNGFWLNQGYIEYMPMSGWTLTAGKFATHIGYEVAGAGNNANVTRGFTYNLLQPISQIGAKLEGDIGGISLMLGVVNGFGENQPDFDTNKDLIWQAGWANDTLTVLFNGEWGEIGGTGDNSLLTLDGVVEFAPTDEIVTWLNVTWQQVELMGTDSSDIGINIGGRLGLGDRMGVAARFEWGSFEDRVVVGTPPTSGDLDLWSITGTFDYLLVEGLTMRTELQYTAADADGPSTNSDIFRDDSGLDTEDGQFLIGVQLVYAF